MSMFCESEDGSSETAANQSWICVSFPERGWTSRECFFLYLQQYNRPAPSCGIVETVLLSVICFCNLPCNIIALVKFYFSRINSHLFLLVSTFVICNILATLFGAIAAASRITDEWKFGQLGCSVWFGGSVIILCMAVWVMTVISFERYICITSPQRATTQDVNLYAVTAILVFLFTIDTALWSYPFFYMEIAKTIPVYIHGVKNDTEPVEICTLFNYRQHSRSLMRSIFMFLVAFAFPVFLTGLNYWKIWNVVQDFNGRNDKTLHFVASDPAIPRSGSLQGPTSSQLTIKFEASASDRHKLFKQLRQHHSDFHIARLMASSFLVFLMFSIPFFFLVAYLMITGRNSSNGDQTVNSSMFVAVLSLMYVNTAINPLIQSFGTGITYSKWHRGSSQVFSVRECKSDARMEVDANTAANRESVEVNTAS